MNGKNEEGRVYHKMNDLTEKLAKTFGSSSDFLDYLQKESKNVFYIKEAEDYLYPDNGYEDPQNFLFRYFKPLNKKGIIELNAFLSLSTEKRRLILSDINKIVCIELDDNDVSYAYLSRMEEINERLIKDYEKLGYQVFIFEENGDILQRLKELSMTLRKRKGDNN